MEKTRYVKHPNSGILVPQKQAVGVQCGYCPEIIFRHKEAGGRLFLYKGRPICARCRILKGSKFSKQIRADKPKYQRDVDEKAKIATDKDAIRVAKVAHESQKRVTADSNSKKKLRRRLHKN